MIFSVYSQGNPNHILGIVNEPNFDDADVAARARFGRFWDERNRCWQIRALTVVPGETA